MSLLSNTANKQHACCLVVVHAPDATTIGRRVPLAVDSAAPVTVGRGAHNDFVLADEGVGEQHVVLEHRAGVWWVHTTDAALEAWVDEVPVHAAAPSRGVPLAPGATLWLGRAMLRFVSGAQPDAGYHEVIYELVTTDALTGLANRRAAAERLEREALALDASATQPYWVITLDVTDLAALRERAGDALCDQVVRAVGRRLHHGAGPADVAARVGPGAFALVRRGGTEAEARAFADVLAGAVAGAPIACRGAQLRVALAARVRACADWQAARAALVQPASGLTGGATSVTTERPTSHSA